MITGKDIHTAYEQASEVPTRSWEELQDETQKRYDRVAVLLNLQLKEQEKLKMLHLEWKVRSLEHLISDFVIFIEELCKWPDTAEVNNLASDLLERAGQFLLKE